VIWVDHELALMEQAEAQAELVVAQAELVVVQAELVVVQAELVVGQVEVAVAGLEQEPHKKADAQRVGRVQSSQIGNLEGTQVLQ
jgi:hypothetical protein